MTVTLSLQTVIVVGSVITALTVITAGVFKFVRWVDRQKAQDVELKSLEQKHNKDVADLRKLESDDIAYIKQEQRILTEGILACLKGLSEKGCNGPVTEAIDKIEDHLNQRAHT